MENQYEILIEVEAEILNLYSNVPKPNTALIGKHGQSFLVSIGEEKILLDVGASGKVLLHNMKELGVNPDEITLLVLSHGHYDHTGGLVEFLTARTTNKPLRVIAHPDVKERKIGKLLFIKRAIGFPELTEEQKSKLEFTFNKETQEINQYIKITGEISNRSERDGREPLAQHLKEGKYVVDPVLDDMSLILDTQEGQVIITGCAHAGILNILKFAKNISNKPIKAIIGGTHMARYSKEEVLETADKFEKEYDLPDLYLNHCTDKLPMKFMRTTKTIDILKEKFGEEKVKKCFVGTKLRFVL